jgi:hypothetical protein
VAKAIVTGYDEPPTHASAVVWLTLRYAARTRAGGWPERAAVRGVILAIMNRRKRGWIAVAVLSAVAVVPQLTPATALADLHNVTYIARIDGVAPNGQATFLIHDNETSSANLGALPGNAFEAHAVLADPNKAGMRVTIPWPYSANVHCEIDVDDAIATQVDQFVGTQGGPDSTNGVLPCGAPLT